MSSWSLARKALIRQMLSRAPSRRTAQAETKSVGFPRGGRAGSHTGGGSFTNAQNSPIFPTASVNCVKFTGLTT